MSKRFTSTILLLLIGVGFGIFSVTLLRNAHTGDDRLLAVLYLVPAVAAFGALLLLPFKTNNENNE
jgi:hypothetical protein